MAHLTPSVILFDELTNAGHAIQAAALQLMQDGIPGCWMYAAANPPDLAAAGVDLTPPMVNRLCILQWEAAAGEVQIRLPERVQLRNSGRADSARQLEKELAAMRMPLMADFPPAFPGPVEETSGRRLEGDGTVPDSTVLDQRRTALCGG